MNKAICTYLIFLLVVLAAPVSTVLAQSNDFETGNKYYEQGEYVSAIAMYKKVEGSGLESAALYYNLGNGYFKSGDLGRSILYYHRAKRLNPADSDIQNNLEFAGRFSTMRMEGVELNPVDSFLKSIVDEYRLKTLGWIASICFIVLVGLLIVKIALQIQFTGLNSAVMLALTLVVITSGLTTFKYRTDFLNKRAVIIAQESSVYSGPSTNADLEFEGSAGLVVEIVRESGDFYDVLFENKRRGWVKKDLLEVI